MDQLQEIERTRLYHFEMLKSKYYDQYDSLNKLLFVGEKLGKKVKMSDDFQRSIGLILTKGIILLKSSYSMVLDGNGQEAGATLRVLIETIELIKYLSEDKSRVVEFFNDNLPSAGNIAKATNGDFYILRKYLNDNASHFSLKYNSIVHLFDRKVENFVQIQKPSENIFITNINMINTFGYFLIEATAKALKDDMDIDVSYIIKLEKCRSHILNFAPKMYK